MRKTFEIHHLQKQLIAVEDVSFAVNKGEFLGIIGKSGSGKSTVLKLIYRTYLPEAGEMLYSSEQFGIVDLMKLGEHEMLYLRKHEIGYVSQFLSTIPRTTAKQLVEQSVIEMGKTVLEADKIARQTLLHFEIGEDLWNHYPITFSGGEKLRLNIACAIVKQPRLLLLDEPTASLDDESKYKVRVAIEKLKQNGTTLIGIFHDLAFMEGLCDKVYNFETKQVRNERWRG